MHNSWPDGLDLVRYLTPTNPLDLVGDTHA